VAWPVQTLYDTVPGGAGSARATSFAWAWLRPRGPRFVYAPLVHRLIAALLVLAFTTPVAALCGPGQAASDPMAGMSCCRKLAPSNSGSVERDCCRMNEPLPEQAPAAPLPPRTTVQADTTPALVALPASIVTNNPRARHDLHAARGRPLAPAFLRTSVLLI
jgi:hypothetical protein